MGEFARAGADGITVHWEATPHAHYALKAVREAGCRAGLALNPSDAGGCRLGGDRRRRPSAVHDGQPGWGGQAFIPESPAKVARLRQRASRGLGLAVDGGIEVGSSAWLRGGGRHPVRGRLRRDRCA